MKKNMIEDNARILAGIQESVKASLQEQSSTDIWSQYGTYIVVGIVSTIVIAVLLYYFSSDPGTPPSFAGPILSKEEKIILLKSKIKSIKQCLAEYDPNSMYSEERIWCLNEKLEDSTGHLVYPHASQHIESLHQRLEDLQLALELSAQNMPPLYLQEEAGEIKDSCVILENFSFEYLEAMPTSSLTTLTNSHDTLFLFLLVFSGVVGTSAILTFLDNYCFYGSFCTPKVIRFLMALDYLRRVT